MTQTERIALADRLEQYASSFSKRLPNMSADFRQAASALRQSPERRDDAVEKVRKNYTLYRDQHPCGCRGPNCGQCAVWTLLDYIDAIPSPEGPRDEQGMPAAASTATQVRDAGRAQNSPASRLTREELLRIWYNITVPYRNWRLRQRLLAEWVSEGRATELFPRISRITACDARLARRVLAEKDKSE